MRGSIWLAVVLAFAGPACSVALKTLPGTYTANQVPHCDDQSAIPLVDLVGAPVVAGGGLLFAVATALSNCGDDPDGPCDSIDVPIAAVSVALGAALFASSIHGYKAVGRCQRGKRAHQEWIAAGKPADVDEVERRKENLALARCRQWRQKLTDAKTAAEKRSLVRVRPDGCP